MTSIVSSTYTTDATGWTIELHTDDVGRVHQLNYRWDGVGDRDEMLAQRAQGLTDQLTAEAG